MDNQKQRDNCLKEVQLHQVIISNPTTEPFLVIRPPKHRQVLELVHRQQAQ